MRFIFVYKNCHSVIIVQTRVTLFRTRFPQYLKAYIHISACKHQGNGLLITNEGFLPSFPQKQIKIKV